MVMNSCGHISESEERNTIKSINYWELPSTAMFIRDEYIGWYHICYYSDVNGIEYKVTYYSEIFHD